MRCNEATRGPLSETLCDSVCLENGWKIVAPALVRSLAAILQCRFVRVGALRPINGAITMFTLLLILLVLALIGGGVGHSRYGYAGWSPAGLLLVILLVLLFTGHRI